MSSEALSLAEEIGFRLTDFQYRRLVAHLMYWKRGKVEAMEDSGLDPRGWPVYVSNLWACGYDYDEPTDSLQYYENLEDRPDD